MGFLWWLLQTCATDLGGERICHVWCCTYFLNVLVLFWLLLGDRRVILSVVLRVIGILIVDDILVEQLLCCEGSYIP